MLLYIYCIYFGYFTVIGINVLPPLPTSQMSPRTPSDKEGFPEELSHSAENLKENERKARKKQRRQRKQPLQERKSTSPPRGNWAVSGTSQWQYPADLIITDLDELYKLDQFIFQKVYRILQYWSCMYHVQYNVIGLLKNPPSPQINTVPHFNLYNYRNNHIVPISPFNMEQHSQTFSHNDIILEY